MQIYNSMTRKKETFQPIHEGKVGIYGGTGFSEGCMPPVPYVSVKEIDEQTDAAGNLKVTLRVKAANN